MLSRESFHPENHLSIGIPLTHSHGLACGKMIFIGGQADIDGNAIVTCPDNIVEQTRIAMQGVLDVLKGIGAEASDLVKLTAFYVLGHEHRETRILENMAAMLGELPGPGPAVTLVPLESNCFDGLSIEIEGIAMRGLAGEKLARSAASITDGQDLPLPFSQALRCEEMIFTSAQTAVSGNGEILEYGSLLGQGRIVIDKLSRLLGELGADLGDAVKANVFNVEPGIQEDWKRAALDRASNYREPGPAATGISLPRMESAGMMLRKDVIAMRGVDGSRMPRQSAWPDGHWDWPVPMPYHHGLKVGDLVFVGGQVSLDTRGGVIDPGDIEAQTHTAMKNIQKVLQEFDMDFENLVKINTFYAGSRGQADLLKNATIRSGYYRKPGPASTGIPFSYLAYEDMLIEIDCVAMV